MTQPTHKNDNDLAVASLVLGIISLTGGSIFAGIPAIITGVMSQKNPVHKGMGLAGIIMGTISTVVTVLIIFFLLILIAIGVSLAPDYHHGPDVIEPAPALEQSI